MSSCQLFAGSYHFSARSPPLPSRVATYNWEETDIAAFCVERVRPDIKTEALAQLMNISRPLDARLTRPGSSNLPGLFVEAGLEDVEPDNRDPPPHLEPASRSAAC
ncbi:hypothetical protein DL765_009695 [Monosporascus sp. GIB2]|nr:hypothetical protein DL765_009695 [Monosporascus sp. GIB2]